MHFTGRTWRPPYEANSCIIQVTSGCTHNKCKFCNLYKDEKFKLSPIEEFEADLEEIKFYQPYARRLFWTGGNPFSLSYQNLKLRALTVRDYLIKCQNIAMFSSIQDIKNKSDEQLLKLRTMGINGLSIGTESGDDKTLEFINKGYSSDDIVEQCNKLDKAYIEYYFVYMTGLAGKGNGYRNAVNTAKIFNKLNPYIISIDSLTLFPNTELYQLSSQGKFTPASEKERIEELIVFIKNLQIRVHLWANSVSNYYPTTAYLPRNKERIIGELEHILKTVDEKEMSNYRKNLKTLG